MYRRDLFGCLVWLGTSIYVCYLSVGLGFGQPGTPGAGFFPFWAGVLMGVFALLQMVNVYRKKENTEAAGFSIGKKWKKTLFVVVSLLLYPSFLPTLGYLIATFVLMGFLFLILGEARRYWLKGLGALFVTLASFFLFYVLLDVRLPTGPFGF